MSNEQALSVEEAERTPCDWNGHRLMNHQWWDTSDGHQRCANCKHVRRKPAAPDTPTPAPQTEIPDDKLNALSLEWHGSGYVQKWEDFLFSKLLESYSENAALADELREAREERDSANGSVVRWHDQYWKAIEERDGARRNDLYTTKASYDLMKSRAEARCAALEAEILRERAARKQEAAALADLIEIAEGAMKEANRDGAEYNVKEDLAEYRALITLPVPATSQPPSQPTGGGE